MGGESGIAKTRLGVMGGAFDPIHYGHLVTAEAARLQFDLEQVIFMPSGQSVQKNHLSAASAEERYLMAVIATAANKHFSVSRFEVSKPGPSYTVDTLAALHDHWGAEKDLFFISGADAVLDILSWKDPHILADYCRFIAATRPGYDIGKLNELTEERRDLPAVDIIEVPALAISSTDLRFRVKEGLPIRYLLPDAVAAFIEKKGLYSE